MKNYLLFATILLCLACKNPKQPGTPIKIKTEVITYYTYGEIPPAGYVYYDTTFTMPLYALTIKNMGGCEPVDINYDSLELHNRKTAALMSKKFGKNWALDFEKQTKLKIIVPNL
ncbi:hypothetical protein [Pedobacter sp. SL55]|uniref:hypothetical protein n=1 Tax=Pedobacter sp. SL55 TaxID=2995161 RepID=UPI002270FF8C|nr:hypothetical protein [Pedobacter sp. SL55]WAC42566.1 hypothetical protein OVA16_09490 [Pedobacter sp. SL55]